MSHWSRTHRDSLVLGYPLHSCPSFPVFSRDRELRELRTAGKNFAVTASPAPRVGATFVLGTRVGGSMESGQVISQWLGKAPETDKSARVSSLRVPSKVNRG